MPVWDAALYLRFADERTRPAADLLARIPLDNPAHVVDLGCGPGNSTELLRRRWPRAAIAGVDNSPEMLAAAKAAHPDARWVRGDAAHWTADPPADVIFSNAALQWVRDHGRLLPRLLAQAAPGGILAVQLPAHAGSPLVQQIKRVAEAPEWRRPLAAAGRALTLESAAFYYDTLSPHAGRLDIWETEYQHVLANVEAIVEWMRGTGLRPYLEALSTDEERTRFEQRLLTGLREAYPPRIDGRVLFPFRRMFILAQREGGSPRWDLR
jgi:trans-aconitate 2-methyltransferase